MTEKTKEYLDRMKLFYDRPFTEQELEKTKILNKALAEGCMEEFREAESEFFNFMIQQENNI